MTTLIRTFATDIAAGRAVDALRATGVRECDIRVLTGNAQRDIRREPVGGWAARVPPDVP